MIPNFSSRLKRKLHRIFGRILVRLSSSDLSIWRTLYVNFYFLPLSQALHLPIYVYGKLSILKCLGDIEISCSGDRIRKGMIRMNQNVESIGVPGGNTTLAIGENCKIIFKGDALIARNTKILLWGGGILTIGKGSVWGLGSDICCSKKITLHDNVRLGTDVKIYDSNFHYTFKNDMVVRPYSSEIELGHHCWIGARTIVMKGVRLPAYTTIASCSLVNRNVTNKERTLIGGIPAKLLSDDFSRLFNRQEEWQVYDYFKNNPDADKYHLDGDIHQYD